MKLNLSVVESILYVLLFCFAKWAVDHFSSNFHFEAVGFLKKLLLLCFHRTASFAFLFVLGNCSLPVSGHQRLHTIFFVAF